MRIEIQEAHREWVVSDAATHPGIEEAHNQSAVLKMSLTSTLFGKYASGEEVQVHTLKNETGMEVHVLDHGATIQRLIVPAKDGSRQDVVLGFDTLEDYLDSEINPYAGAVIGRCAGRIPEGIFDLDGERYTCNRNAGVNTLHGGYEGFDRKLWKVIKKSSGGDVVAITMTYTSADGEEGFPGELETSVTFELQKKRNELKIMYRAITTKNTVCSLTHHDYFNLSGHDAGDVLDHMLQLETEEFFPMQASLVPIGPPHSVVGTPFDFREAKMIRDAMQGFQNDVQLAIGSGIDHSFRNVNKASSNCVAYSPKTGIKMEVKTTHFATHIYTGNFIDSHGRGKGGAAYRKHSGFALETQNVPNAIKNPHAPSSKLAPGEVYEHSTIYRFSVKP